MGGRLEEVNRARFVPGSSGGFYESYFQRGNHPSRPLAFWIRYTLMCPRAAPERTIGELWAVWFNGETGRHVAVKQEVGTRDFGFDRSSFDVRVAGARLDARGLTGAAASGGHEISWDLGYEGEQPALLLLRRALYRGRFPRAKALVGRPLARYRGTLEVDRQRIAVDDWIGSQNHNWGTRHTDHYAWGQVAGFDDSGDAFLEVATGRLKLGPLWTPAMTLLALRIDGRELRCDSVLSSLRARASLEYFDWRFDAPVFGGRVRGRIRAPRRAFVGLRYRNPPGGVKFCLNSKIAGCRVEWIEDGAARPKRVLESASRAAFEILTDDPAHGVELLA